MNHHFSKTLIRWSLAFILFYSAILDLRYITIFPKLINFYFIFLAVWLFIGRKIIWSSYLTFITFSFLFLWKIILFNFNNGFIDFGLSLIALSLIGLIKHK